MRGVVHGVCGVGGMVNDVAGEDVGMVFCFLDVAHSHAVNASGTARDPPAVAREVKQIAVVGAGSTLICARNERNSSAVRGSRGRLPTIPARLAPRLVGGALIGVVCVGGARAALAGA